MAINRDILMNCGETNYGGISQQHIYYTYLHDIDNFPKVVGTPTTFAEAGKTTGDFTFKVGTPQGKWNKLETIPEGATLAVDPVGEIGGQSWENKLTLRFGKIDATKIGFLTKTSNSCFIFLVMDNNGFWRIIGDHRLACQRTEGSASQGEKIADLNQISLTFVSKFEPAPIYAGTLPDGTTPVYN